MELDFVKGGGEGGVHRANRKTVVVVVVVVIFFLARWPDGLFRAQQVQSMSELVVKSLPPGFRESNFHDMSWAGYTRDSVGAALRA